MQQSDRFDQYPDELSDRTVSALRVVSNAFVVLGVVIWTFVLPSRQGTATTIWQTDLTGVSPTTQFLGLGAGLVCLGLGAALAFLFLGEKSAVPASQKERQTGKTVEEE